MISRLLLCWNVAYIITETAGGSDDGNEMGYLELKLKKRKTTKNITS